MRPDDGAWVIAGMVWVLAALAIGLDILAARWRLRHGSVGRPIVVARETADRFGK